MLILVSTITGCVSISAFASLVSVLVDITSSAVGIKIYAVKKYQSIIKKKKKKHDEIVFLGEDKFNTIEVLISKALIDSYINHNEFVSVNNWLIKKSNYQKPRTPMQFCDKNLLMILFILN